MSETCSVSLDGQIYPVSLGDNLLSALLRQGALVPHSCLAGACGSCKLYQPQGEALLACQQSVQHSLTLLSKPAERFTIALDRYEVTPLSDQWCKVAAHCSLSLPLGAVFRWQLDEQIGRSVSCSTTGDLLTFYFPTRFVEQLAEVRIEQGAQRAQLDISASHLLLYSAHNQVLAQDFQALMRQAGFEQSIVTCVIDMSSKPTALSFQRFDKALVLNDQPAALDELEQWLSDSRCRVAEFTFMTHSN
ncbi:hypothetical protein MAQ5080_02124 [Marinomonas aquimarina]|uniref:2Fe-2S ferredoxin-type domain-containing protein n=1 Tax=Marinomonas aquimarina TaxID=295068 RepID=A0A1A8TFW5_9GAMM|nr:2Fe-2S iron-sulfur cluster binding domain-containing protein [Marinomonas aquimarina]SBS31972.1 hypothetical protein MAQ5080_02124 [Marinomonas aquimarina]